MLKGKKLGGLFLPGGDGGPEATVVSDEDEAAEMEDEAVRSQVQHKSKVRGGAAGARGSPGAFRHHYPPHRVGCSPCPGALWLPLRTSAPSLCLCLGFWLSQCPPAPISESNPGLPMAPRRTSSG